MVNVPIQRPNQGFGVQIRSTTFHRSVHYPRALDQVLAQVVENGMSQGFWEFKKKYSGSQ
jgi:hypothetical protein